MAMHTELWFPSVIWSAMTHFGNNSELKRFAYDRQKIDPGTLISNCGGYQSSGIVSGENAEVDILVSAINSEILACTQQVGLPELELYNIWININPPKSYNNLHGHAGSVLSGVYYVEATEHQGNIQFERSDNAEYHIPVNIKKTTYYTSTRATYAAKTGAMYIFPSWLKHSVQMNNSTSDRISISFNYGEKR
jgi:uncharacterized protein (TIGR02466 family)